MQGLALNEQGVKGIGDGTKTMFREPADFLDEYEFIIIKKLLDENKYDEATVEWGFIPKYQVSEVVYVQESFYETEKAYWYEEDVKKYNVDTLHYQVKPPHEMQEHQARYFLKIKSIKVERLQDISEEDCVKEGVVIAYDSSNSAIYNPIDDLDSDCQHRTAEDAFVDDIWNNLPYKAPYDWNSNPYVFVYEFEKFKDN